MDAQSRETVRQHATSLPPVGKHEENERILDGGETHVLWADLKQNRPVIQEHIKIQVDFVLDEVVERLNTTADGNRFVVTREELRGALVRMAIHSTAQSLYDVGGVLHEASQLNKLLIEPLEEPDEPSA